MTKMRNSDIKSDNSLISHTMEGWDIAYKVKFLIVVNLVTARAILVSSDIQVDTLFSRGPSG